MVGISGRSLAIFWETLAVPWAVDDSVKLKAR